MRISGELTFPGDKSISHRALMLAALTNGECIIDNLSTGVDVESTRQCLMTCGVQSKKNGKQVVITGNPLKNPASDLDCGNSGTTARLLTGLLAGQRVTTTLTGDKSLSQRPMERIIQPLGLMGASFENENGYLPLRLNSAPLTGIEYSPPVASAQVKSAILFAGLGAEGETTVIEKTKTRDHTERMLHVLGADIRLDGKKSRIKNLEKPLKPFAMKVPGDPSTAAFFAAAAALVPGSNLILKGILSNPTRTGFFSALEKMGAGMECLKQWKENGEDVGDLRIFHQSLKGINISGNQIPTVIDELPILAILATQAEGVTTIQDAQELRVKESDRISAICVNLRRMGANVEELEDGFVITGPTPLLSTQITTHNDHRIAMAFSIAGLISDEPITLDNPDCIRISCPEFNDLLKQVIQ